MNQTSGTYLGQAGTANAYPQPNVPTPNPTVNGELTANEKRIEELHQRLGLLEQRLAPVLRATGPTSSDVAGTPPMPWSAVVCALRNAGFQVEAASARIEDLISRLDV